MHEGLPVAGYLPQSTIRVDLVNSNKLEEERLLRRIEEMVGVGVADARWAAIARTHFELGWMALNRAIFQPYRIKLPEDDKEREANIGAERMSGSQMNEVKKGAAVPSGPEDKQ